MGNFCGRCGTPLPIGTASDFCSAHGGPQVTPDATIRCPFCAEQILASAKKCKHCGEFLEKRNALPTAPTVTNLAPGDIICPNPNCRYQGPPKKVARGSILVGLILLCLFILPGVLYFVFMQGYRYSCPRCGLQIRTET
jgi:DNA-directed RNA polymerase subunit RPC12/RpoP